MIQLINLFNDAIITIALLYFVLGMTEDRVGPDGENCLAVQRSCTTGVRGLRPYMYQSNNKVYTPTQIHKHKYRTRKTQGRDIRLVFLKPFRFEFIVTVFISVPIRDIILSPILILVVYYLFTFLYSSYIGIFNRNFDIVETFENRNLNFRRSLIIDPQL